MREQAFLFVGLAALWMWSMGDTFGAADRRAPTVNHGATRVAFEEQDGYLRLSRITDRVRACEFLLPGTMRSGLWRVELRAPTGEKERAVVLDEAETAAAPGVEALRGGGLRLTWAGLRAGGVDVAVTVKPMRGEPLTDWRIAVRSRLSDLGIWQVDFPRLQGLTVGKTGQAALPFGMGMVQDDPVHNPNFGFADTYPSCLYSMQFASLSEGGSCLYLGTHDPKARVKRMRLQRLNGQEGLVYEITQFPENMGLPGHDYTQPYPCVLGVIGGDWVDATKLYRRWVLPHSDWMRGKAPLAQRKDLPDWLKRLPFWVGFHGMTDDAMAKVEAVLRAVDVPAAVHLYHWHQIPFDTHYPDFWPPYPQVSGYVKRLHELGARVMPYINCHLMDRLSASWKADQGWQYTAAGPGKDAKAEVWSAGTQADLVAMCPATTYWQGKFDGLAAQLACDLDVDGIYCDQVACVPPTLCHNPAHGHPLGGGYHWVEGHNRQIARIRRAAATARRGVFLTTESAAEPYDFDLFLRCNEGAPFLTPIWQMVYSGYRLSFGFYFYEEREWLVKFATQYLWGVQIGWAGQHDPKAMANTAAFEREAARARYAASDYLALGEMLRPPVLEGQFARIRTTWRNFANQIPIDWPSVQGSLWRAPDGSLGLALVNLHAQPETVTFRIERNEAGLGRGPVRVKALYPTAFCPQAVLTGDPLVHSVTLPPRSAALVTLRRS